MPFSPTTVVHNVTPIVLPLALNRRLQWFLSGPRLIKALKKLKKMAEDYGFDISGPATNAKEAVQ